MLFMLPRPMRRLVLRTARTGIAASCAVHALASGLCAEEVQRRVHETERRSSPVFTVYFENDGFSGEDRHYTNGLKLSWLSADLTSWGQSGWRRALVNSLPFVNREGAQKNFG